jgi:radical SAM-linked protein
MTQSDSQIMIHGVRHTDPDVPQQRLRMKFAKGEPLKYISHLDLARTWERVFRRAGLPVAHSQGYNPRPRFQIAAALPVGVTGQSELLDIWLTESLPPGDLPARLQPVLPPGLVVMGVEEVDLRAPSLQSQMRAADYRVVIHTQESAGSVGTRVQALLDAPALLRQRHHKGKLQTYDLRPLIHSVRVASGQAGDLVLNMRLQASPEGAGRPDQVLDVLGLSLTQHAIERTNLCFEFDK